MTTDRLRISCLSHKHYLAAPRCIELVTKPVPRGFCDFATSNNECVINKHTLADLWIENLMAKHHCDLTVDFGYVSGAGLADTCCIVCLFLPGCRNIIHAALVE